MVRKKWFVVLIVIGMLTLSPVKVSAEMQYSLDDYFKVEFTTYLQGSSRDYEDYTETEIETRTYTVDSISGDLITWNMERNYSYSDNEDNSLYEETSHQFTINGQTREYINNTIDAPTNYKTYYKFDYTWFRIDPDTPVGTKISILGNEYEVKGLTHFQKDFINIIEVIEVRAEGVQQTINDSEYDPDGSFTITFDDSYYYDPETGYFVAELWTARALTSVGNFDWEERGVLLESSYPIDIDEAATQARIQTLLINLVVALVVLLGLAAAARFIRKRRVKASVVKAVRIMAGELKPPRKRKKKVAPSLWNPLHIDYQSLLQMDAEARPAKLRDGIYVVVNPDDTIAIAQTIGTQKYKNLLFAFSERSMELLYRLALGIIDTNAVEFHELVNILTNTQKMLDSQLINVLDAFTTNRDDGMVSDGPQPQITSPATSRYLEPSVMVAEPDSHSESMFLRIDKSDDPWFNETVALLARRKVLDYTLGQAPLMPSAHLKKLRHILRFEPQRVLMVGDDDLISVSLARRGIEVTLLEVDPYTCALIALIAQEENLNIRIQQVDLRSALPLDQEQFDLFVADPDFTIEAFALFLSRGLSMLRIGGIGLINFESSGMQKLKANYLLEMLDVEILERSTEKWHYAVILNKTTSNYHGKYSPVTYTTHVQLNKAPYSSVMFTVRKTEMTRVILESNESLKGVESVIYDF